MQADAPIRRDIVLIGGGHAHVEVIKQFGMRPEPGVRLTLISAHSVTPYSGMLPGYLAGHYALDECNVDLRPLCRFAGARLYDDRAVGVDLEKRVVLCARRPPVPFDLLSIDIGSTPAASGIEGAAEHTLPVKPVEKFLERWAEVEAAVIARGADHHVTVIGAGAGGVEAALALQFRLKRALSEAGKSTDKLRFSVVSATRDPLPTHARTVRRRMRRALDRNGVAFLGGHAAARVEPGRLHCEPELDLEFDTAVLVTPASAAPWLRETGLALDGDGFIRVRETLQTETDPAIFAAGDIAAFGPRALPKSGVYAVREGPYLARSLRRMARGGSAVRYPPQRRTLALVSMGEKRAVMSYGPLAAEGGWVWRLKDLIDRRWMRKYQDLPDMQAAGGDADDPEFDPMRCGGCGAKVAADILGRVLADLPAGKADGVVAGLDAPDDAAILAPPPGKLLVQTVDQFRAFIDDPWLFGRITANHCLGDIYAMGAAPVSAQATVALPFGAEDKLEADLRQLLLGALVTFGEAGVALVGGHTGEGAELSLGFAVNGYAEPEAILRKGGLKPGDALVLTKPLGTGVILAGDMRQEARAAWVDAALAGMLVSNRESADIFRRHGASAATDVTGFGLIGHLGEMARASGASVEVEAGAAPLLPGVAELFARGIESSLQPANLRAARPLLSADADLSGLQALFDPQTAGGLLAGVSAAAAEACIADLRAAGYAEAAVVGKVTDVEAGKPVIAVR